MANEQVSLPYLAGILLLSGLILRYLFFSGAQTSRPASGRSAEDLRRSREAAAERIQQMFPQTDRRTVLWDLQRNGGSVQSTTERILAGRLEMPPVTFQPPPPPGQPPSGGSTASATRQADKPSQPDLITRYNLESKIEAGVQEEESKGKGWSSNREERQMSLQRRRDEMILAARRKMEAKIAAERAGPGV